MTDNTQNKIDPTQEWYNKLPDDQKANVDSHEMMAKYLAEKNKKPTNFGSMSDQELQKFMAENGFLR